MKKIDNLVISSFLGPFMVSFGIAMFVLVMQFLWLYIDDIAGKGLSMFIIAELLGYMSVTAIPLALPIAVILASVMEMGNFAERYELSSMKSAGLSLLRVMSGLILICAGIAFFSYVCSDFLIPKANLKFRSRLADIRRSKPVLTMEEGVLNDDFKQFVIRIGKKEKDQQTIRNVLIENQLSTKSSLNQILADSGQMFTTGNGRFFVMNLFNGEQYQEPAPEGSKGRKYPFIRTKFQSWTKVFDMKEFEMNQGDESRLSSNRGMQSMEQLARAIDSLEREMVKIRNNNGENLLINLNRRYSKQGVKQDIELAEKKKSVADSIIEAKARIEKTKAGLPLPTVAKTPVKPTEPAPQAESKTAKQILDKPLAAFGSYLETFDPAERTTLKKEGMKNVQVNRQSIRSQINTYNDRKLSAVRTGYELYLKYSYALVCFVFLFIGAPMGAIIRKGGFGYPILVSIIFFVTFVMLAILCRKLAESGIMNPFWAAMMPCVSMMPIGLYLTIKATNDSQLFNVEFIEKLSTRVKELFNKRRQPA